MRPVRVEAVVMHPWRHLLEAGHQEDLHITALQKDLMSQAPYVLQLLRLQPTASTLHFMRGQYSSSVSLDGISLDFRQV